MVVWGQPLTVEALNKLHSTVVGCFEYMLAHDRLPRAAGGLLKITPLPTGREDQHRFQGIRQDPVVRHRHVLEVLSKLGLRATPLAWAVYGRADIGPALYQDMAMALEANAAGRLHAYKCSVCQRWDFTADGRVKTCGRARCQKRSDAQRQQRRRHLKLFREIVKTLEHEDHGKWLRPALEDELGVQIPSDGLRQYEPGTDLFDRLRKAYLRATKLADRHAN